MPIRDMIGIIYILALLAYDPTTSPVQLANTISFQFSAETSIVTLDMKDFIRNVSHSYAQIKFNTNSLDPIFIHFSKCGQPAKTTIEISAPQHAVLEMSFVEELKALSATSCTEKAPNMKFELHIINPFASSGSIWIEVSEIGFFEVYHRQINVFLLVIAFNLLVYIQVILHRQIYELRRQIRMMMIFG